MRFKRFAKDYDERKYTEMVEDLNAGLSRLRFLDNFESEFKSGLVVPASSELQVRHSLGVIPRFYLIVRQTGDARIIDGDTGWTNDNIYLKNTSGSDATISLFIFK